MIKIFYELSEPFLSLKNRLFARLYLAQTISLLGDAFTWVGLALLAFQFGAERSAVILASALTLRVITFIIFSPFAGVLADRIDRKKILYTTHFIRMAIVCCLGFISEEWQIYVLVFFLNVFNAFFTPTYKSVIPQIVDKGIYRHAIGLSTATYQLLGILGPALAGILAIWLGVKDIFFVDAFSFIISGILIITLPGDLIRKKDADEEPLSTWQDVVKGARLLFSNKLLQFALFIEFVSAIAGAQILVNTIGYVKGNLHLTDKHYGIVMSAFGIGAAIAAFFSGAIDKSKSRKTSLVVGALVLGAAILSINYVNNFYWLITCWVFAGLGQSLAEIPSEILIGENIPDREQGKVYGSHFAFSHLWWAIAYPVAGYLGTKFPENEFFFGGLLTLLLVAVSLLLFRTSRSKPIE
ncbi:MAG: MFS transporter [Cytophagaceae bacterium]